MKPQHIIIGLIILASVAYGAFWYSNQNDPKPETIVTEEAIPEETVEATTAEEKAVLSSAEDGLCPENALSESYITIGNGCTYREGQLFETVSPEECRGTASEEFNRRRYNIVNDCVYGDGELVLAESIGKEFASFYEGVLNIDANYFQEWGRFIQDNTLYLYINMIGDCGGCSWIGPYVTVNLGSGTVEKGFADLPYPFNSVRSPKGTQLVSIHSSSSDPATPEVEDQKLYHIDLITEEVTEIYTVPDGETLISYGDGWVGFINEAITWKDENTITVARLKVDTAIPHKKGMAVDIEGAEWDDPVEEKYEILGTPVEIVLSKDT